MLLISRTDLSGLPLALMIGLAILGLQQLITGTAWIGWMRTRIQSTRVPGLRLMGVAYLLVAADLAVLQLGVADHLGTFVGPSVVTAVAGAAIAAWYAGFRQARSAHS